MKQNELARNAKKLAVNTGYCLVIGGLFLSQMMKPVMGGDAEAWERKLAAKVGPFVRFLTLFIAIISVTQKCFSEWSV